MKHFPRRMRHLPLRNKALVNGGREVYSDGIKRDEERRMSFLDRIQGISRMPHSRDSELIPISSSPVLYSLSCYPVKGGIGRISVHLCHPRLEQGLGVHTLRPRLKESVRMTMGNRKAVKLNTASSPSTPAASPSPAIPPPWCSDRCKCECYEQRGQRGRPAGRARNNYHDKMGPLLIRTCSLTARNPKSFL